MTKLSVIVPCYNCSGTLEEAVDSIYRQDVAVPFDLTLVDDGSIDNTYALMNLIAQKYPNVNLVKHEANRGGGAARNSAVNKSDGDIIFCLDSDDILGSDCLKNLVNFWLEKRCDGVGISTSIKFNNTNIDDIVYITEFPDPGKKVRVEFLLDWMLCPLYSTFLITREAFYKIGGYPTDHGFDTQAMAFRFLCNGLTALTCPDTEYYHRLNYHVSYYLREVRAGRNNWNWFKILDEFLYIFRDEIKARILESDLFPTQGGPDPPELHAIINRKYDVFANNYLELVQLGRDGVASRFENSQDMYQQYWLGGYHASNGHFHEAINHFKNALELGFNYRIIHCKILDASLRIAGTQLSVGEALINLNAYITAPPARPISLDKRIKNWLIRNRYLKIPVGALLALRNWLRRRQP